MSMSPISIAPTWVNVAAPVDTFLLTSADFAALPRFAYLTPAELLARLQTGSDLGEIIVHNGMRAVLQASLIGGGVDPAIARVHAFEVLEGHLGTGLTSNRFQPQPPRPEARQLVIQILTAAIAAG